MSQHRSSCHGSVETNLTGIHEDPGLIPGLTQWVKKLTAGAPIVAQWLTNPTSIHEDAGSIPGLLSGLSIRHCHELWCRLQT